MIGDVIWSRLIFQNTSVFPGTIIYLTVNIMASYTLWHCKTHNQLWLLRSVLIFPSNRKLFSGSTIHNHFHIYFIIYEVWVYKNWTSLHIFTSAHSAQLTSIINISKYFHFPVKIEPNLCHRRPPCFSMLTTSILKVAKFL
jgi:hypothetical protein